MQRTGRTPGDTDLHDQVAAALATSRELGPEYDEQIASGLLDRTKARQPRDRQGYLFAIRDSKYIRSSIVAGLATAGLVWGFVGNDGPNFTGHDPWAIVAIVAVLAHVVRSLWTWRTKP